MHDGSSPAASVPFGMSRVMTAEIMDSLELDAAEHRQALAGLKRLNRAAGAAGRIAKPILFWLRRNRWKRLQLLDVACGGGDVPTQIARVLAKGGIQVELLLFDRSSVATAEAGAAATALGIVHETQVGDAASELPTRAADIVTNSLFLHHLHEQEVIQLLTNMKRAARHGVVVSDLRRSWAGYLLAVVMCRLLSRSRVVHFDGPVSVKAAWTMGELREMAKRAGMRGAKVERQFPFRMLLTYFPGEADAV